MRAELRCKELERIIKESNKWFLDERDNCIKLEQKLAIAKEALEMVADNSKMPHQHSDYYLRLCCLSERANEVLTQLNE
jgi:CHASE3 domain sensor protein